MMRFQRILSLTPSITETIFALAAEERLVGVTDACDYPAEVNAKSHVCSWFDPDLERIAKLRPDLLLGLASAHGRLAEEIRRLGAECVLFNPTTIDQALEDMDRLASLLEVPEIGRSLTGGLQQRLSNLDQKVRRLDPSLKQTILRVLEVDAEGLIVAGPKSFQYDGIRRAGGLNVTTTLDAAYPRIDCRQMKEWDPAVIFVCGTDNASRDRLASNPDWQELRAIKNNRLYQFDCGLTCRTGPRIVDMAELLFATLYN